MKEEHNRKVPVLFVEAVNVESPRVDVLGQLLVVVLFGSLGGCIEGLLRWLEAPSHDRRPCLVGRVHGVLLPLFVVVVGQALVLVKVLLGYPVLCVLVHVALVNVLSLVTGEDEGCYSSQLCDHGLEHVSLEDFFHLVVDVVLVEEGVLALLLCPFLMGDVLDAPEDAVGGRFEGVHHALKRYDDELVNGVLEGGSEADEGGDYKHYCEHVEE
mmetsp:Transcript_16408/g.33786  ORF Transcript_16408/g.33786 Transcript_16408/m.33786 type:complete len:213 (+) Transcript_16408:1268-1906(+)